MTEPVRGADTAGGMLRAAREKQGLHIAALAASIKVAPRKLDALENNRWDELPDATFIRALAQTVCRTLKIDARPVLDLLPAAGMGKLDNVAGTLNMPFRERGAGVDQGLMGTAVRPMLLAGTLFLVAALTVYLAPASWWDGWQTGGAAGVQLPAFPASEVPVAAAQTASEPIASAGSAAMAAASAVAGLPAASTAANSAALPTQAATGNPAPPATGGAVSPPTATASLALVAAPVQSSLPPPSAEAIQLKAIAESWVEARDAQGRVLVSRLVVAGEDLVIEGDKPVRLVIGNAAGVELRMRQQRVDLQAMTRDNVARLQLP